MRKILVENESTHIREGPYSKIPTRHIPDFDPNHFTYWLSRVRSWFSETGSYRLADSLKIERIVDSVKGSEKDRIIKMSQNYQNFEDFLWALSSRYSDGTSDASCHSQLEELKELPD